MTRTCTPRPTHITTVHKQFQTAKKDAGITDPRVVLYCARHTFGTVAMADSQNPAAVMDAMGHKDLKTTLVYQHQDLRVIKDAIDRKNERLERTQIRTQRGAPKLLIYWLPPRDSNPDMLIQSQLSCH